jgi:hypothetical protein
MSGSGSSKQQGEPDRSFIVAKNGDDVKVAGASAAIIGALRTH